jgi:hypothetical protein
MPVTNSEPDLLMPDAFRPTKSLRVETVHLLQNEILVPIRDWCFQHADRVAECYLVLRPGEIVVYVVGKEQIFDFSLMRNLSALTAQLIEKDWPIEGNLLPASTPEQLTAFVDPREAILCFRV